MPRGGLGDDAVVVKDLAKCFAKHCPAWPERKLRWRGTNKNTDAVVKYTTLKKWKIKKMPLVYFSTHATYVT